MSLIGVVGGIAATTGADYAVGKAIDLLGKGFKAAVIERWSRKRAEAFVTAFCATVVKGTDAEEIDGQLAELMADEQKSQALFDAYRRVVMSASPVLGPRIIALVMARIVGENRQPTTEEDKLMTAAERMTDAELSEARDYFDKYVSTYDRKGTSYYSKGEDEDSAGLDFWADWGSWAAKLASFGFIYSYIEVKTYRELDYDEGRVIEVGDDIRHVKLRNDLYYAAEYKDLAELITRAEKLLPGSSEN
jgi:hypothetical protein